MKKRRRWFRRLLEDFRSAKDHIDSCERCRLLFLGKKQESRDVDFGKDK